MVGWAYPPVAVVASERGQSLPGSASVSRSLSETPPRRFSGAAFLVPPRAELGAMWRDGYRQGWRSAMAAVRAARAARRNPDWEPEKFGSGG